MEMHELTLERREKPLTPTLKALIISLLLPLILIVVSLLLRQYPPGADAYAFLMFPLPQNTPPGSAFIFNMLGTSIAARYFLAFLLMAGFSFGTYLIARLFVKKYAWLAPLFCFASPLIFIKLIEAEDDAIGYFFIPIIWFFFFKARLAQGSWKKLQYDALTICIILFSTFFIWHGNIFFLLAFAGIAFEYIVMASVALAFFLNDFIAGIKPLEQVGESVSIMGIGHLFFLLFGFIYLPKEVRIPSLIFLALTLINARNSVFLIVPLSVGMVLLFEHFKKPLTIKIGL